MLNSVCDRTSHALSWFSKHLWHKIRNIGRGPENKAWIPAGKEGLHSRVKNC